MTDTVWSHLCVKSKTKRPPSPTQTRRKRDQICGYKRQGVYGGIDKEGQKEQTSTHKINKCQGYNVHCDYSVQHATWYI